MSTIIVQQAGVDTTLVVEPQETQLVVSQAVTEVIAAGQQGPEGIQGDQGIPGPQGVQGPVGPGGAPGGYFAFMQSIPSALWVIEHNLNLFPAVTIVTSGGDVVEGDIFYVDSNKLSISFSAAFSGQAYLV